MFTPILMLLGDFTPPSVRTFLINFKRLLRKTGLISDVLFWDQRRPPILGQVREGRGRFLLRVSRVFSQCYFSKVFRLLFILFSTIFSTCFLSLGLSGIQTANAVVTLCYFFSKHRFIHSRIQTSMRWYDFRMKNWRKAERWNVQKPQGHPADLVQSWSEVKKRLTWMAETIRRVVWNMM